MDRDAKGRFIGLPRTEAAALIHRQLSPDKAIRAGELAKLTGLSMYQVLSAIRYLREVEGSDCIVCNSRGYQLAENALDVRDYAERLAKSWRTQIGIMKSEMALAQQIFPDAQSLTVRKAAEILSSAFSLIDLLAEEEKLSKTLAFG